jgi:hypothetical protein
MLTTELKRYASITVTYIPCSNTRPARFKVSHENVSKMYSISKFEDLSLLESTDGICDERSSVRIHAAKQFLQDFGYSWGEPKGYTWFGLHGEDILILF